MKASDFKNLGIKPFNKGLSDLGNNIYCYLQPDGGWGWSNAGLIADGDESLIVDTLFDEDLTLKMLDSMKSAEPKGMKNIRALINSHSNGGGSLLEANALAHLFLGAGTKVQVKTSSGSIHGLGERRGFQFYDGPLVILVNRFSASASEILAGAIQDYERGLILGTDTFGKGTVQRVQALSSGQIKFTESKFYRVSGKSTQSKGISPDIYLPSPINTEEFGENKPPLGLLIVILETLSTF